MVEWSAITHSIHRKRCKNVLLFLFPLSCSYRPAIPSCYFRPFHVFRPVLFVDHSLISLYYVTLSIYLWQSRQLISWICRFTPHPEGPAVLLCLDTIYFWRCSSETETHMAEIKHGGRFRRWPSYPTGTSPYTQVSLRWYGLFIISIIL